MKRIVVATVVTIFIGSCAVGPDYKRPNIKLPEQHRGSGTLTDADKKSFADLPWWEVFKDPILKSLIEEALRGNLDLRIAAARAEQFRELARIPRGDYYPQLNYSAMGNYGKNVPNQGLPDINKSKMGMGDVSLQWEIDVWGKVRRASESATAQYFASIEARRDITLILITDVANAYFQLRALDNELEIAKRSTDSFKDTYDLFTKRYKGGDASLLGSTRAGAALAQVAATIPDLENQIFETENQINFLLGRTPGPVPRGFALSEQYMSPKTPAGLPSALLERRPDIREAEQSLVSANADIGVAKANFFPQFSLTGLLGASTPDLKAFSHSWSVGGNVAGPIFNGGKIFANYEATKQAYEQVKSQYEKTVMNALREVANAIMFQQKLEQMRVQQQKQVDFLRTATKLSLSRYTRGLASYTEVLDAQQQLFPAESSLAVTEGNRLLAMVQLFRALGGGWDNPVPPDKKKTTTDNK